MTGCGKNHDRTEQEQTKENDSDRSNEDNSDKDGDLEKVGAEAQRQAEEEAPAPGTEGAVTEIRTATADATTTGEAAPAPAPAPVPEGAVTEVAPALAAMQENLPHPNRGQQSDLIKLSAVGASAFALGGYVNQSLFNQQKKKEEQTAREKATMRIRQLEEQLAAAEAEKRLQTAVDFYNHTATLNNNTSCQFPDFFNQSCLLSAHPGWMKAAPLGMSALLVGGYVAQKVRRSYNALYKQLETSTTNADNLQGQLTSEKEARAQAERDRQKAEGQLETSTQEKKAVENQLTQTQRQLAVAKNAVATKIQRAIREFIARKAAEAKKNAATKTQATFRGFLVRKKEAERQANSGSIAAKKVRRDLAEKKAKPASVDTNSDKKALKEGRKFGRLFKSILSLGGRLSKTSKAELKEGEKEDINQDTEPTENESSDSDFEVIDEESNFKLLGTESDAEVLDEEIICDNDDNAIHSSTHTAPTARLPSWAMHKVIKTIGLQTSANTFESGGVKKPTFFYKEDSNSGEKRTSLLPTIESQVISTANEVENKASQ